MSTIQAQPWQESFSTREIEVLQLISEGGSNRDIAQKLHLSIETVKWYNKQMFMKLDVKNRVQLINKAAELNLFANQKSPLTQEQLTNPGNLPAPRTSFVGREKEIRDIIDLIQSNRLVVLTGTGGSGKTRLALKVGEALKGSFKDGVWLVELANIQDPALVAQTISRDLGITESTTLPLEETLKRYLSSRHLLLILDNLEHLLPSAPFIGELLDTTPQLVVLGTSRERLQIYGEQEYPIQPLKLPIGNRNLPPDELRQTESIELFIKRAQGAQPDFTINQDDKWDDLVQICTLLDGLPLAIELCAPLVKTFSLKEIADRVDKSLDAIPKGPKDLHRRQQTIRATIQWSYDLLGPVEKSVLIRMAVFNGGVTLRAIKAICGVGISRDIGDILFNLANKNLDTYNQFADRHVEYFFDLARQSSSEIRGPDQIQWTDRMISLSGNFRAALKWTIEKEETQTALGLSYHLYDFWLRHADFEEAHRWLEQILALPGADQHPVSHANALNALSWIVWFQGRADRSIELSEKALSLVQSQPDNISKVVAHLNLGAIYVHQEDGLAKGKAHITEASEISHEIGARWEHARSLMLLALIYLRAKDYNRSYSYYIKAYNLYEELGDINFQSVTKRLIGDLEIERGNVEKGKDAYQESLTIAQVVKNHLQVAYNFIGLSNVAAIEGNHLDAFKFHLAGKEILENVGVWSSGYKPEWEKKVTNAQMILGEDEIESILLSSHHMTNEEAIEFAMDIQNT
jgi:predicted ATPase/DNA-binding CsgD family transcriptional regulator